MSVEKRLVVSMLYGIFSEKVRLYALLLPS